MHVEAKDDESIREHCTEIDNCIEECYTFCRPGIDSISSNCTVLGSLTEPGICCCKLYKSQRKLLEHFIKLFFETYTRIVVFWSGILKYGKNKESFKP